jgi:hypothetical protein
MYEDKIWFYQSLLNYKDKKFTKNGILDISINSNTEDYKTFSSIAVNFSISNDQIRKTQYLNYQNVNDLVYALKEIVKNESNIYSPYSSEKGTEIIRKYSSDKTLRFNFKISTTTQEKICIVSIINNESDFTRIVVDLDLILNIINLLTSFINDFINLSNNFINRCISTELLVQTKILRDSIKTLPSFFGQINVANSNGSSTPKKTLLVEDDINDDVIFNTATIEGEIDELDKFLGENMSNIKIPEIDNEVKEDFKEKPKEITSTFVKNFLRSDLSVLENVITSTSVKENPFGCLIENIKREIGEEILPEITELDLKSISYLSKKMYLEIFRQYAEFGGNIPNGTPSYKYSIADKSKIKEINKTITLDLLLFLSYFKNLKDKLEMRESNSIKNKSILYIGYRLFFDPLLFTFLYDVNPVFITSLLKERFVTYKNLGVFDSYTDLLKNYGLEEINEKQIMEFIDNVLNIYIKKCVDVKDLHDSLYEKNSVKIPYDNELSLEQITNEMIRVELQILFEDIKLDSILYNTSEKIEDKFFVSSEIASCISKYFNPPAGAASKAKQLSSRGAAIQIVEKKSMLERATQFWNNGVPARHREEFDNYLKNLEKNNFDPKALSFDINELDENILKAIYVWNSSDKKYTINEFNLKIEECILDKNTILSTLLPEVKSEKSEVIEDWENLLN